MSKTLQQLTEGIVKNYDNYVRSGTVRRDAMIASRDLSYQVGTLNKLLMQLHNQRRADTMLEPEIKEKIADELSDIIADTLYIASELDINMDKAWDKMIESDTHKIEKRRKKHTKG